MADIGQYEGMDAVTDEKQILLTKVSSCMQSARFIRACTPYMLLLAPTQVAA